MKIGPSYEKSLLDAGGLKPGKKTTATSSSATTPAADVRLSDLSSRLAQLESQLSSSDPVDTKKVEAVKAAISEGRFKVNPEVVADKLMSSVREMLGK